MRASRQSGVLLGTRTGHERPAVEAALEPGPGLAENLTRTVLPLTVTFPIVVTGGAVSTS